MWPRWARWLAVYGPELADASRHMRATHGYPPDDPGVHGLFYAWGAGVTPAVEVSRMNAIDIHPPLARLLDIARRSTRCSSGPQGPLDDSRNSRRPASAGSSPSARSAASRAADGLPAAW